MSKNGFLQELTGAFLNVLKMCVIRHYFLGIAKKNVTLFLGLLILFVSGLSSLHSLFSHLQCLIFLPLNVVFIPTLILSTSKRILKDRVPWVRVEGNDDYISGDSISLWCQGQQRLALSPRRPEVEHCLQSHLL